MTWKMDGSGAPEKPPTWKYWQPTNAPEEAPKYVSHVRARLVWPDPDDRVKRPEPATTRGLLAWFGDLLLRWWIMTQVVLAVALVVLIALPAVPRVVRFLPVAAVLLVPCWFLATYYDRRYNR